MTPANGAAAQRAALAEAVEVVGALSTTAPELAIVLGTGLGGLVDAIDVHHALDYAEIPHFPPSTVEQHAGRLLIGTLEGRRVVALQGRLHRYEGYSLQQVVFPVRVVRQLGARDLIITNVSGCMNPLWQPGELVLITDHINLLGDNPLIGPNLDELGPRFPDMSMPYDHSLQQLAEQVALELRMPLRRGVYTAVTGPNLETRAEYRMLRAVGADIVGMSTVPEVIAAVHAGMRVLGISIITDRCLPDALEPADVDAIIRTAKQAEPRLSALVRGVVAALP